MARTGILTGGTNSAQTTSEDLNAPATDFISNGVVGVLTNTSGVSPATGGLAVNAQGTPDRTTAVTAGTIYVTATPTSQGSQRLRVKIDAQNVTHATNSTGSNRFDWIYVSVDAALAANPIADMSTTGTVVVSRSTSSTTDNGTPPTYGVNIAVVTLANSFTTVTNANIADKRVRAAHVGGLNDTNGNEVVKVTATASAVNEVTVTNAATGNGPQIAASGGDTNIDLKLAGKGTGRVSLGGAGAAASAVVLTSESRTASTYGDLTTTTDTVTVTVGTSGMALVSVYAHGSNAVSGGLFWLGFDVSGASTQAASDTWAAKRQSGGAGQVWTIEATFLLTGLTAGSTTFKLKYKSDGTNAASYANRRIGVVPL